MNRSLRITEARAKLMELPEELARESEPGAVTVTRRGEPVLAILPWEFYEALVETLEALGDEDLMTALRQGIEDLREGRVHDWEDVKRDLGL